MQAARAGSPRPFGEAQNARDWHKPRLSQLWTRLCASAWTLPVPRVGCCAPGKRCGRPVRVTGDTAAPSAGHALPTLSKYKPHLKNRSHNKHMYANKKKNNQPGLGFWPAGAAHAPGDAIEVRRRRCCSASHTQHVAHKSLSTYGALGTSLSRSGSRRSSSCAARCTAGGGSHAHSSWRSDGSSQASTSASPPTGMAAAPVPGASGPAAQAELLHCSRLWPAPISGTGTETSGPAGPSVDAGRQR